MTTATHYLIAFASRWGTALGGINSFNTDLLKALGVAVDGNKAKIICVVLDASEKDKEEAERHCVLLLSLNKSELTTFADDFNLKEDILSLLHNYLINIEQIVWLGHDRITGHVANAMAKTSLGGRSAIIHHMSFRHYESFVENAQSSSEKEQDQEKIFSEATIKLAIGPLLQEALMDMLDEALEDIHCLIPGLPVIEPRQNEPRTFITFMSGRVGKNTNKLKQAHLAVAGVAYAIFQADQDEIYPDCLKGRNEPSMIVRGVELEDNAHSKEPIAEQELMLFAEGIANRVVNLHPLPFTTDKEQLLKELRKASVAIMPSWHEGFGLVAWEAIGAAVPLIITKKSGVYKLIEQLENGRFVNNVISLDIQGQSTEPFHTEQDKQLVAESILAIAKNYTNWKQKAITLREELLKQFTWKHCAEDIFKILNWDNLLRDQQIQFNQPVEVIQNIELENIDKNITSLLKIPTSYPFNKGLSLSVLLRAEQEIISFDEKRKSLLDEQITWAIETEYPLAIRLITGIGGSGKTRLALQLCKDLVKQDWRAGFLNSDFTKKDIIKLTTEIEQQAASYCIVIDYAETRTDLLADLFKSLLKIENRKVRVLLLARDRGEWWDAIGKKEPLLEALLLGSATTEPIAISSMYQNSEREQAYIKAIESFATVLDIDLSEQYYIPDLLQDYFSTPLYIQMAALLTLQGEQSESAEQLPRALVNHEQRYWTNLVADEIELNQAYLLMIFATLTGEIKTCKDIEEVWEKIGFHDKVALRRIFGQLKNLYPDQYGLEGLKPDLLGESLVAEAILSNKIEVIDLITELLNKGSTQYKHHCLTVFARLVKNQERVVINLTSILKDCLVSCIREYLAVCIETPSDMFTKLFILIFENLSITHKSQLIGIIEPFLMGDIVILTEIAVTIYQEKVNKLAKKLNRTDCQLDYAIALSDLSISFERNGNIENALDIIKDSLYCFDNIPKKIKQKEDYKRGYINALNNYAYFLGEIGEVYKSLEITFKALELHKNLLSNSKIESLRLLGNYVGRLYDSGDLYNALIYSNKVLGIAKELFDSGFEQEYAFALYNNAQLLYSCGDTFKAFIVNQISLEIYEPLFKEEPYFLIKEYVDVLINHYVYLSTINRPDSEKLAHNFIKYALNIYEDLYNLKPLRFSENYVIALVNYTNSLDGLNNESKDTILELSKKAISITRRILLSSSANRVKALHILALNNYAVYLNKYDRNIEAIAYMKEVIKISRTLSYEEWPFSISEYAMHLSNYSSYLLQEGDSLEEAHNIAIDSVMIFDKLINENKVINNHNYIFSLDNLAECYFLKGDQQEALNYNKKQIDFIKNYLGDANEDMQIALNNKIRYLNS